MHHDNYFNQNKCKDEFTIPALKAIYSNLNSYLDGTGAISFL